MLPTLRKLLISMLFCFAFVSSHAQQIDPTWQINWPTGYPIAPSPTGSQTITQLPGTTLNLDSLNNTFFVGTSGYSTVQAAVNAAGTTGSVTILASYTGTDTWTNAHNITVTDLRLLSGNGIGPAAHFQARQKGVQCNGEDDTAAIQAALDTQLGLAGQFNGTNFPSVPGTVELPQGYCVIKAPLKMNSFGSLVGSANGTWLQAAETFACNSDGCDIIQVMIPYTGVNRGGGSLQTFPGTANRVIRDINLEYFASATAITGIHVFNETGHSAATPYPASPNTQIYQLPFVRIEGVEFFAMDTAIDVEDCDQCDIDRVQIDHVRQGIVDGGNVFDLSVTNTQITNGSWTYTPTHSTTWALLTQSQTRYLCSNANPNCSGGTTSLAQTVSPQGFNATAFNVSSFDIDANIVNMQGGGIHGSGFDYGGDGPTGSVQPTVLIGGNVLLFQFDHNYVATNRADSNPIEISASTGAPGTSSNQGIWITDNQMQAYPNSSTAYGIVVDPPSSASFVKPNLYLNNNQCYKLTGCVLLNGPVTDSTVNGNYGSAMASSIVAFNYAGTTSFTGVTASDNTTPNSITTIKDIAGSGYHVGWNYSPAQLTGTQTVSKLGCTITAGAIGNTCDNTIVIASSGGIAYPDTNYSIVCQAGGGTGLWTVGNQNTATATQFVVPSVALSTSATGGGVVECTLTHN